MIPEAAVDSPLWLLFASAMFGLFLGIGLVASTAIVRVIRKYLDNGNHNGNHK